MNEFEKICIEILNTLEEMIKLGKKEEALQYIENKREYVETCRIMSKNAGEYVDALVSQLK